MAHKVTFHYRDEEHLEIFVDDSSMGSVSHDSVGWDGMEAVEMIGKRLAVSLGAEVVVTEGEEE